MSDLPKNKQIKKNIIKMNRKCVCTIWRLGEVETQQVIRFGAVLPVAHHQLASLAAAEAEVLVCVFALRPQLPLLGLQLGVPGLLLLLHHHHALEQKTSREGKIQVTRLPKKQCPELCLPRLVRGGRGPHRRLHAQEPGAVVRPAVTGRSPVAHAVEVVVERQLRVCRNSQH